MSFEITVRRREISVAFEVGSLKEGAAILEEEDTQLRKIAKIADSLSDEGGAGGDTVGEVASVSGTAEAGETSAKRRGRPAKAAAAEPDPATAQAPAPLPIPPAAAPPTAPVDMTPNANGIPAFLDRSAAAAPPPPPPPPAPVVVPPSGILAGKVIAALDARAVTDDLKKQLVDWLASPNVALVNAGSTYDETIAAIRLMADDKLANAATALAIA